MTNPPGVGPSIHPDSDLPHDPRYQSAPNSEYAACTRSSRVYTSCCYPDHAITQDMTSHAVAEEAATSSQPSVEPKSRNLESEDILVCQTAFLLVPILI